MQWLSLVREHLIKNLSLDEEDFDLTPLLHGRGGAAKARMLFRDQFQDVIRQLNTLVAT